MKIPVRNKKAFDKAAMLMRFAPVARTLTGNRSLKVVFNNRLPPLMWPHHVDYDQSKFSSNGQSFERPYLTDLGEKNNVITLPRQIDPRLPERMSYFRARIDMGSAWLRYHDKAAFADFCKAKRVNDDRWGGNGTAMYDFRVYENLLILEKARCDALMAADLDGAAVNIRHGLKTYGEEILSLVAASGQVVLTRDFFESRYRKDRHTWTFTREALYFAALTRLRSDLVMPQMRMRDKHKPTNKERHLMAMFGELQAAVNNPARYWHIALKITQGLQTEYRAPFERLMPSFFTPMRIIDPHTNRMQMLMPGEGVLVKVPTPKSNQPVRPNQTASAIQPESPETGMPAGAESGSEEKAKTGKGEIDPDAQPSDESDVEGENGLIDLGEIDQDTLDLLSKGGKKGPSIRADLKPSGHWGEPEPRKSRKPMDEEDDGIYFAYDVRADRKIKWRDMPPHFVPHDARAKVTGILLQNRAIITRISRDLRRLFPAEIIPDHWESLQEEGNLDLSTLSKIVIDPSFAHPYKKITEKHSKKSAVMHVLVDISKTVNENPQVNDQSAATALIIAGACEQAGIPCEITAVTTGSTPAAFETDRQVLAELGRTMRYAPLLHVTVKPYNRLMRHSKPGLDFLFAKGNGAADAASIMREHNEMLRRREDNRFLVMISDMRPESGYYFPSIAPDYDHFEGSDCAQCAKENSEHLRKVTQDIYQTSPVHVIGLGVGDKAKQTHALYPRHLVLNGHRDSANPLADLFVPLLSECIQPAGRTAFGDLRISTGPDRPRAYTA